MKHLVASAVFGAATLVAAPASAAENSFPLCDRVDGTIPGGSALICAQMQFAIFPSCAPFKFDPKKYATWAEEGDGNLEDRRSLVDVSFTVRKLNGDLIFKRTDQKVGKVKGSVQRVWDSVAKHKVRRLTVVVTGKARLDGDTDERFEIRGQWGPYGDEGECYT